MARYALLPVDAFMAATAAGRLDPFSPAASSVPFAGVVTVDGAPTDDVLFDALDIDVPFDFSSVVDPDFDDLMVDDLAFDDVG